MVKLVGLVYSELFMVKNTKLHAIYSNYSYGVFMFKIARFNHVPHFWFKFNQIHQWENNSHISIMTYLFMVNICAISNHIIQFISMGRIIHIPHHSMGESFTSSSTLIGLVH